MNRPNHRPSSAALAVLAAGIAGGTVATAQAELPPWEEITESITVEACLYDGALELFGFRPGDDGGRQMVGARDDVVIEQADDWLSVSVAGFYRLIQPAGAVAVDRGLTRTGSCQTATDEALRLMTQVLIEAGAEDLSALRSNLPRENAELRIDISDMADQLAERDVQIATQGNVIASLRRQIEEAQAATAAARSVVAAAQAKPPPAREHQARWRAAVERAGSS